MTRPEVIARVLARRKEDDRAAIAARIVNGLSEDGITTLLGHLDCPAWERLAEQMREAESDPVAAYYVEDGGESG